jgi:YVTN family beta-propeller protein
MNGRAIARGWKVGALGLTLLAVTFASGSRGATTFADLAQPQVVRTSGDPAGIAIDLTGQRAYVADTLENTLFVFDLTSGAALAHVPTGLRPSQVVLSEARAFISNFADHTVTVVDTATNRAIKTLAIGGLGLAVDAEARRLFAAEGTRIAVLDLSNDTLVTSIAAPQDANVWGLALDAQAHRLYATDIAHPRVLVFDSASGVLVREVALAAPARFGIAAGAPGQILVAGYTDVDPQLAVIDANTGRVIARRAVAAFSNSVALQPSTGLVFTTSTKDRSLMSADTGIRATLAKAKLTDAAGAVAVNPLTGEPIVVTAGGTAPPARALPDVVPLVKP